MEHHTKRPASERMREIDEVSRARSCPRSFRSARVARFGQDDKSAAVSRESRGDPARRLRTTTREHWSSSTRGRVRMRRDRLSGHLMSLNRIRITKKGPGRDCIRALKSDCWNLWRLLALLEALEGARPAGLAQFAQRLGLDLADTLAGDGELFADFLER